MFSLHPVVQKIRSLASFNESQRRKTHKVFTLSKEERNALSLAIDMRYNHFSSYLKNTYHQLNEDDLFICILLRMEVSNEDTAYLLSCSEEALKKRKFRIKKEKMGLPSNGKPLEDFLKDLCMPTQI